MRRGIILLSCLAFLTAATAQSVASGEVPGWNAVPREYLVGLAVTLGCCGVGAAWAVAGLYVSFIYLSVLGLLANHHFTYPDATSGAIWAVTVGGAGLCVAQAPAVAGIAVARVGSMARQSGSTWGAVAGGYLGASIGIGAWALVRAAAGARGGPVAGIVGLSVGVLGTPAGAVAGYSLFQKQQGSADGQGYRLGLPSLSLTRAELADGTVTCGAKLNLLSFSF